MKRNRIVIAISTILAVALIVASVITVAGPEPVEATIERPIVATVDEEVPDPEPEVKADLPTWHFYNLDLQDDGDEDNDFNFGPAPETTDKENEALFMDAEFRTRMQNDPALGAADMAWFDANLGTRYLGVFYDECDEEWPKAINEAKEAWIANRKDYEDTLGAFFEYLDSAEDIAIRDVKGLTDQMYMNPHMKDEVPDVIVMETDEHEGKFLVYTFKIKGTTKKEVMYRLECGFQPTNVAKILKVKPQKRVGGGGISGGGGIIFGGGGKPGPKPTPTPRPTPTPTPRPKKDPTEGTKILPNDDPGPGENTNNPDDPDHSKKDNLTNSTNLTPEEYKEAMEEIKDANSGGDGPSTPPPTSDTNQDSNESKIDTPTEKQDSSVAGDESGGSWDGPPD